MQKKINNKETIAEILTAILPLLRFMVIILFITLAIKYAMEKRWMEFALVVPGIIIILMYYFDKLNLNTKQMQDTADIKIEKSKVLPTRVEDNSFKQKTESVKGISQDDLK